MRGFLSLGFQGFEGVVVLTSSSVNTTSACSLFPGSKLSSVNIRSKSSRLGVSGSPVIYSLVKNYLVGRVH